METEKDRLFGGTGKYSLDLDALFKITVERHASDLHLLCGAPPHIRVDGDLIRLDMPIITPDSLMNLLYPILNNRQIESLEKDLELDFAYSLPGISRFRGNVMFQRGTLGAAFRVVPYNIPSIDSLGLPKGVRDLCSLSQGLVLVTGPTGSGKSTTLAAMLDYIGNNRRLNILTLEDPIEFLHKHGNSIISQREVGSDTHSFSTALRHALRHDPDVILIGEMRDLDSISIALTAAETGHLVLSTLHTQNAPLTINRIVDVFNADRRSYIRQQLSNSLQAIVSQQLIPRLDGKGRTVSVEFMLNTPAVRNMIREGKEHQLYSVLQTGHALGMQTMDQALERLYNAGKISSEKALSYCIDRKEMERMLSFG
ncbi:MAG TPA: type IV pilus twitching motility protein PilT [Clostridia bacterium]|nr:type IV pilus twitching motility protein PilT [Clostridia bacterium]